MLAYLEIARHFGVKWVVWENVPGVLSSAGGRDFGAFLGALGELGYGWAYRVLDAQWFGVAQRRRRVFVVGCLGDQAAAAKVLFESESVRRDTPPSREKGKGPASFTPSSIGGYREGCGTLDKDNFGAVLQPIACAEVGPTMGSSGPPYSRTGNERVESEALALHPIAIQGNLIGRDAGGPQGVGASDKGVMYTMTKTDVHGVATAMQVRRLTPIECERLQGFPDGYTAIPWRKKACGGLP